MHVQFFRSRHLHHFSDVHHCHTITDVLDHTQIVRDEQIRQVEFALQVLEQVERLRPNGTLV